MHLNCVIYMMLKFNFPQYLMKITRITIQWKTEIKAAIFYLLSYISQFGLYVTKMYS